MDKFPDDFTPEHLKLPQIQLSSDKSSLREMIVTQVKSSREKKKPGEQNSYFVVVSGYERKCIDDIVKELREMGWTVQRNNDYQTLFLQIIVQEEDERQKFVNGRLKSLGIDESLYANADEVSEWLRIERERQEKMNELLPMGDNEKALRDSGFPFHKKD